MSSVSKYQRQAFSIKGRFVVAKPITVGDKILQPGDSFPWRRLGFKARRVETLYKGRFLEMRPDGESS